MTALQEPPVLAPPVADEIDEIDDKPRKLSARTTDDIASLIGSFFGSLGLVWVCYEQVLAFSGIVGFVVCWWFVFLVMYMGVTALSNPLPAVLDRAAATLVTSAASIIGAVIVWVVVFPFVKGWPALKHANFYTQNMNGVRPTAGLNHGGIWFAIVGTLEQVGIATAISLPLGVATAIYLAEVGGRLARVVRTVVEAMTALPDILAGLFIYAFLIIQLHWQQDGLAVALALSVTMTPIVARSAEVVLRVVPGGLREASLALGASTWGTVWRVVLPTARAGLTTSLILGIARVAGETAPLLIVDQATTFWNKNPTSQPQSSLPLFIYSAISSGETENVKRGYGAAAVLLTIVLVLFITARFVSRDRLKGGRSRPRSTRRPAVDPMSPFPARVPGEDAPMDEQLPDNVEAHPYGALDETGPLEPVGDVPDAPPIEPEQAYEPLRPYVPPPPYTPPPPFAPPSQQAPPEQHTPYWASQIPSQSAPESDPNSVL